ncbi:hypothetical protein CgunFtcFv8_002462 [Champsocephalus gunnari]|uniref:Uncharacterized protein n=1 Tax=Champsocephalus gunnari TaxID=52237 RepID=A0AAN8HJH7_CHAGU|nr:hypothetical protein CgunFtcFv8_002462 [Champsocephalus gunnari]
MSPDRTDEPKLHRYLRPVTGSGEEDLMIDFYVKHEIALVKHSHVQLRNNNSYFWSDSSFPYDAETFPRTFHVTLKRFHDVTFRVL